MEADRVAAGGDDLAHHRLRAGIVASDDSM
jgi:hypothetical protein